jgi:hypothetical protein
MPGQARLIGSKAWARRLKRAGCARHFLAHPLSPVIKTLTSGGKRDRIAQAVRGGRISNDGWRIDVGNTSVPRLRCRRAAVRGRARHNSAVPPRAFALKRMWNRRLARKRIER